jgi:hypothetical protein
MKRFQQVWETCRYFELKYSKSRLGKPESLKNAILEKIGCKTAVDPERFLFLQITCNGCSNRWVNGGKRKKKHAENSKFVITFKILYEWIYISSKVTTHYIYTQRNRGK